MIREIIGGTIVALALAGPAFAQQYDWSGPYVGVTFGDAFGDASARTSTSATSTGYFQLTSPPAVNSAGTQNLSPRGITGGIQGGLNWQLGKIVLGFKLGFGAYDTSDTRSSNMVYPCCAPETFTIQQTVSTDWLLTAGPSVGYAFDKFLVSVGTGVAVTNINYKSVFTDGDAFDEGKVSSTNVGWMVGTDLEYALSANWTLSAEYLYADFGSITTSNLGPSDSSGVYNNPFNFKAHLTSNIFRLGLNYRF